MVSGCILITGQDFLGILGFKVFRSRSFRSGLRFSGRAVRLLVGFVFRVSFFGFQVGSWHGSLVFWSVFRAFWSFFGFPVGGGILIVGPDWVVCGMPDHF